MHPLLDRHSLGLFGLLDLLRHVLYDRFILILVVRLSLWPHETSCAVESYVLIRINFQGQYFPLLCLIVVDVKIRQNSDGKSVFIVGVRVGFTQQVNELFSLKGLIALVNEFYSNEMSVG